LALSRSRPRHRFGGEDRTGGPDRVERVVLSAKALLCARAPTCLDDYFTAVVEETRQPSAIVASALDCPNTNAARVTGSESESRLIATSVSSNRRLRNHGTRRSDNNRERVLITVCVHTDDVVHLICKHPTDPPTSFRRVPVTPVWMQGNRAASL
jgi:hypothetical protein